MTQALVKNLAEMKESVLDNPLVDGLRMAGVNHKSAAMAVRECIAIPKGEGAAILELLSERFGLDEVVALSTCNRTEFYWTGGEEFSPVDFFMELPQFKGLERGLLEPCLYSLKGPEAAAHLFEVTSGLDSLVLGETQILGQVKRAYERSRRLGFTDTALNLLFQKAFEITKQVHTQTSLYSQKASIPSVALTMASAIFEDMEKAFVVVVGTGEIARLTLESLKKRGAKKIAFVTRTTERAKSWGEEHDNAEVVTLSEIDSLLHKADVLVACTRAEEPVITAHQVQQALKKRKGKPMLFLDLGMPRNIDPAASKVGNVYLHNVDDLQAVVEKNKAKLEVEVKRAEAIIAECFSEYIKDCCGKTAGETIGEVRTYARQVADEELKRTMNKLAHLSDREKEELETLAHRIIGKLLHHPSEKLRNASREGEGDEAIAWARRLFGLGQEDGGGQTK